MCPEAILQGRALADLTTAELRALWQANWPVGEAVQGVWAEQVYAELLRRAESAFGVACGG